MNATALGVVVDDLRRQGALPGVLDDPLRGGPDELG
jgi:hypothetical protein